MISPVITVPWVGVGKPMPGCQLTKTGPFLTRNRNTLELSHSLRWVRYDFLSKSKQNICFDHQSIPCDAELELIGSPTIWRPSQLRCIKFPSVSLSPMVETTICKVSIYTEGVFICLEKCVDMTQLKHPVCSNDGHNPRQRGKRTSSRRSYGSDWSCNGRAWAPRN